MQVMRDRVLLQKIEPETKTASGLILAHVVDETFRAKVIKVGNGKMVEGSTVRIPLTVKEGDTVIYNPNATISVTVGGEKLLIIKEEDIFAILDEPTQ